MGLRQRLANLAVDATHVLVVESPGGWRTRIAIEREAARRGWRLAMCPADADALVIAGTPGPQLSDRVEAVWEQLPGPRTRTVVASDADASTVRTVLDAVAAELLDTERQSRDARERGGYDPNRTGETNADVSDMDSYADMNMSGDMDMSGDQGSGGDMDMDMAPSGIPLAEGGDDRDGLEMDVLHLPLGPVLPHWPAGLVLHCTLHGDVVVAAEANALDEDRRTSARLGPAERAALRCDQLASLLALAGWADGQSAAVRLRDALIVGLDAASGSRLLDSLERRLRRAWWLRWSLRGIGDVRRIDDSPATPAALCGDVHDRLLKLIDDTRSDLAGTDRREVPLPELLAVAERLVVGVDLAATRLVVASLAIDTSSQLVHTGHDPGFNGA